MRELVGELYGDPGGARIFHIGAFAEPRIQGHPVTWISQSQLGPFRLAVPPGTWYIHAVGVPDTGGGWPSSTTAGSHGGIYGHGAPVTVPAGGPLRIHMSPLWRDLTHAPNQRQPGISDEHWRLIHLAMEHMAADLSAAVENDLGPAIGLTRTRLSALFKRGAGLTLEEYRMRLRLEAAKALLVQTDLEVLEIALEVGYATSAQLGRIFQRFLGVSPTEFRRLARGLQAGAQPPARSSPSHLLRHLLLRLSNRGATLHGELTYNGMRRGSVIYIGAFPGPVPTSYPVAWTALPAPGPFTLRGVPEGLHYILACYCSRRMYYPGDIGTAFAYGGYGYTDTTGQTPYFALPLAVQGTETIQGLRFPLVGGDYAATFAGRWGNTFLPDGR